MIKFLYKISKGYRRQGAIASLLTVSGVTLSYVFPLLTRYIIDVVLKQGLLVKLMQLSLGLIVLYLIRCGINFWSDYLTRFFRENTAKAIKLKVFNQLLYSKLAQFQKLNIGDVTSRIIRDIDGLKAVMLDTLVLMAKNILVVILGLGIMFYLSPQLALLILPFLPLIYLISYQKSKKIGKLSEDIQKGVGRLTSSILQPLYNLIIVKCYALENSFLYKFDQFMNEYIKKNLKYGMENSLTSELISFAHSLVGILLFFLGGLFIIKGDLTLGTLVAATYLSSQIFGGVSEIAGFNLGIKSACASFNRIKEILGLEMENQDGQKMRISQGADIEFRDVYFSYLQNREVLKGVSFRVKKGSKVALVGPSGAGKSTLIKLLLKFYPPTRGEIRINGDLINEISIKSIRENIAFIPQEDFLFEGTIEDNIKIGKLDANADEIEQAIDLANLRDFINGLPEGYSTSLGERGLNISGGERQRISLARAFLKNSPIIILDEATSQLDAENEYKIREAVKKLFADRTVIIIAHRLSTVIEVDSIVVLNNGKVIAQGAHSQLYNNCPFYRKLCDIQFIKENVCCKDTGEA